MHLTDDIQQVKGIGEKTSKLFHKLNIMTIGDLLSFYPRDYESLQPTVTISELTCDKVLAVRARRMGVFTVKKVRNLTITTTQIYDTTGKMHLTFFNMPYIAKSIEPDKYYIFRGSVKEVNHVWVMEQPKIYTEQDYAEKMHTLQPVYVLTKGLSNATIQKAEKQSLQMLCEQAEILPETMIHQYELISNKEALQQIHMPCDREHLLEARKRLVFHEFFFFMLAIRQMKEKTEVIPNENIMIETADTIRLLEQLPYRLTKAQLCVWEEIKADLSSPQVMNRLIQGDVGSGKTIVAILALLMCVANGYQGAMMAPTEVLAKQHFETIAELAATYHLPFHPVLLTGSLSAKEKKLAYAEIEAGEANVILGTHALIQEKVAYQKLALVVTDEQHRFGVRQREALAGKGEAVHVLVMSATPIPRTLAIILYGDLHVSVIDELPADRVPIKNCVVTTEYRKTAYAFMQKEIAEGRQVYIVCPMVEEGELENVENVVEYAENIRQLFPKKIQIGILHGKMKPMEKNKIMEAFKNHDIDILVSTTVIEVGINVPNATVMMIENAERFGLAQLHQLRGRVGRGKEQSYCIFVSGNQSKKTMDRLRILNQSNDGFVVAEEDLKLRGPGDIFGIRQSGLLEFRIGDIYTDAVLLKQASEAVEQLLTEDKNLQLPENQPLKQYITGKQIQQVDFRTI